MSFSVVFKKVFSITLGLLFSISLKSQTTLSLTEQTFVLNSKETKKIYLGFNKGDKIFDDETMSEWRAITPKSEMRIYVPI